jgi:formate dehydrogenase beta subunit
MTVAQPIRIHKPRPTLKGRQPTISARAVISELMGGEAPRRDLLIEYLHRIQDAYLGLSDDHLTALADWMRLSTAEVFEVATFYHHFDLLKGDEKAASLTVRVCDGLSCALAGAETLLAEIERLNQNPDVRLIRAPCVGRCEQAPVAVVHQHPVIHATSESVMQCIARDERIHPEASPEGDFDPVKHVASSVVTTADNSGVAPAYVGLQNYLHHGGYQLLRDVHDGRVTKEAVLQAMTDSGLRGLGGAGFPAGRKWQIVAGQPAPRLLAVNIDEGEPGTFKDRTYLERDPHRFLEGMLVAAATVGIDAIYIYLRDEYHGCRALLTQALKQLREWAPMPLPLIELRRGAGAYICGEESAMIESIEGKRGEPRMRPPYIAEVGLFGRPTLEHNFETLYWVRDIVQRGAAWFSGFGRNDRQGLRSFSVSGRVQQPGVKLAPAGITLRELIDTYCGGMLPGHTLYAYFPGGASGGILPARLADVPLDFDTLQPHGCFIGSAAIVVLSDQDRASDAALNTLRFFTHESCGQCTPCRVGTDKAATLMAEKQWDWDTLNDLATVMADASICGLGQAVPNPIRSVATHFAHEVR